MISRCAGWQKVFSFTFVQTWKSKATIITTLILFLLAVISLPGESLIENVVNGEKKQAFHFKEVYIIDETGMGLQDFSGMKEMDERCQDIDFVTVDEEPEKWEEKNSVLLKISYAEEGFMLAFSYGDKSDVTEHEVNELASDMEEYFPGYLTKTLSIDEEIMEELNMPVKVKMQALNKQGGKVTAKKGAGLSGGEYSFAYVLLFVSMMCITLAGEGIASAIVVEKANRVVEYLMTAVEPMAIVVGKVCARLAVVILQLLALAAGMAISLFISSSAGSGEQTLVTMLKEMQLMDALTHISAGEAVMTILFLVIGFVFYGMIAGLAGAMVSRVEDTAEGIKLFTILLLVGVYLALYVIASGLDGGGVSMVEKVAFMLPISSPFIVPAYLCLGKIATGTGIVALVVLVLCTIAVIYFVATIYESMIFYNGNTLKIKDLIRLFKQDRDASSHGAVRLQKVTEEKSNGKGGNNHEE